MERRNIRYEPQEKIDRFILRLPDSYNLALNGLVKKGAAKSKNELIVEVIAVFLSDLRSRAETEVSNFWVCKCIELMVKERLKLVSP